MLQRRRRLCEYNMRLPTLNLTCRVLFSLIFKRHAMSRVQSVFFKHRRQACTAHVYLHRYFVRHNTARRRRLRFAFIIYLFLIISKIRLRLRHLGRFPAIEESTSFQQRDTDERQMLRHCIGKKQTFREKKNKK